MRTAQMCFLLSTLASVSHAGPESLRGAVSKPTQRNLGGQDGDRIKSDLASKANRTKNHEVERRLAKPKRDSYSGAEHVEAFSETLKLVDDPSWQQAGDTISAIGSLVAVAVPPPAGVVASGLMGIAGGLMSIFGGKQQSEPSNTDILRAMNKGFERVGIRLDELSTLVGQIQKDLDQLTGITGEIYVNTVLQGGRITLFTDRMVELSSKYEHAQRDTRNEKLMDAYTDFLYQLNKDFADMRNGALEATNLEDMLDALKTTQTEGYSLITASVTLYRWFFQARTSLLSVLLQTYLHTHRKLDQNALDYIEGYAADVQAYEEVLQARKLAGAVPLTDSQLSTCSANADSVMEQHGLSIDDFMHPYVYLAYGDSDCSHPVGGFNANVLAPADQIECKNHLFWDGRGSSLKNLRGEYAELKPFNLKTEWLKSCPTGVEPRVQIDNQFLQDPGCGCRLYREDDDFHLVKSGSPGQIKHKNGLCLTVSGMTKCSGTVRMQPCEEGNQNQQWKYNSKKRIQAVRGICLHTEQRKRSGAPVTMRRCIDRHIPDPNPHLPMSRISPGIGCNGLAPGWAGPSPAQDWTISTLVKNEGSFEYEYHIEIQAGRGICLGGEMNKQGGRVQMQPCDRSNRNQQWQWKVLPDSLPMCRNKCFA